MILHFGIFQEQELYIQKLMTEKNLQRNQITADQMSEFYKKFLDDRLDQHWNYNWFVVTT